MGYLSTIASVIPFIVLPIIFYRFLTILDPKRRKPIRHGRRNDHELTHLLIVLGSGGHTAEMISMLERAVSPTDPAKRLVWSDYNHRTWVVGSGDSISAQRAKEFEELAISLVKPEDLMVGKVKKITDKGPGTYEIVEVPRARAIHQPVYTAPVSSLMCMRECWKVLTKHVSKTRDGHGASGFEKDFPDLILCNGPATATILVFTSVMMRFLDLKGCNTRGRMRTIYVESWARVRRLSLSGTLLKSVADRFLVQWPQLKKKEGSTVEFLGVLV